MQTRNPFLDDVAKAVEGAMSFAQSAGEEARAAVRAQADRMVAELDLVRRDEFEALRSTLTAEIDALRSELARSKGSTGDARPVDDAG
jgi:BMFP domain-containing protein YqiC